MLAPLSCRVSVVKRIFWSLRKIILNKLNANPLLSLVWLPEKEFTTKLGGGRMEAVLKTPLTKGESFIAYGTPGSHVNVLLSSPPSL
jgi:hypothetical protein